MCNRTTPDDAAGWPLSLVSPEERQMSPDSPIKALRTEMESRLKTCQATIGQCQKDIKAQYEWCADCRKERRDQELKLLNLIEGLGKRVDGFSRSMGEFVTKATALLGKKAHDGR
jgi:hypothetical protein